MTAPSGTALAVVGGRLLTGLVDVTSDLAALDGRGLWAVVLPFDGEPALARGDWSAAAVASCRSETDSPR